MPSFLRVRQGLQHTDQWTIGGFPVADQQTKTAVFLRPEGSGAVLRARDHNEGEYVTEFPLGEGEASAVFLKDKDYDYTPVD